VAQIPRETEKVSMKVVEIEALKEDNQEAAVRTHANEKTLTLTVMTNVVGLSLVVVVISTSDVTPVLDHLILTRGSPTGAIRGITEASKSSRIEIIETIGTTEESKGSKETLETIEITETKEIPVTIVIQEAATESPTNLVVISSVVVKIVVVKEVISRVVVEIGLTEEDLSTEVATEEVMEKEGVVITQDLMEVMTTQIEAVTEETEVAVEDITLSEVIEGADSKEAAVVVLMTVLGEE